MKMTPRIPDSDADAKVLKVTRKIPLSRLSAARRAKHAVELMATQITKQQLAQFNANWYESVLISLAVDPKAQVVEINIIAPQVQQFLKPHPGIIRLRRLALPVNC